MKEFLNTPINQISDFILVPIIFIFWCAIFTMIGVFLYYMERINNK